jgi:2-phosphosulfolactate phosphatase
MLYLHALLTPPAPARAEEYIAGNIAVAIDVFRATTSFAVALKSGAQEILPIADLKAAEAKTKELRARQSDSDVLLCGERGGVKPAGFDLGNSPLEYAPENVRGKTLVFTSTNGANAVELCAAAELALAAAFVNLRATAQFIARYIFLNEARAAQMSASQSSASQEPPRTAVGGLCVVCAGDRGDFSYEDTLCAGALLEAVAEELHDEERPLRWSDTAKAALRLYQSESSSGSLATTLRQTLHAERLRELGFEADVEFAVQRDIAPIVSLRRADGALVHWHNPLQL